MRVSVLLIAIVGLLGLGIYLASLSEKKLNYTSVSHPEGEKVNTQHDTLYENEKRIQLVRGADGHVHELVIHHTIKRNVLPEVPRGILEF